MTNSAASPRSRNVTPTELVSVIGSLLALITVFAWWLFRHDYLLYYGDAQAHLDISRSIIDSKTPGYDQLGTVWLPLLHVVCLPFVGNDWLWSTGLAGTIPVALFFVMAGTFLYLAARCAFDSRTAALASLGCFATNPNVLYLSAIPMTETLFLAGVAALVFAACRFGQSPRRVWIALAVVACWLTCLTRYDGWFLIPFAGAWLAWHSSRRFYVFVLFCSLASVAPAYWFAHNWWETGNAVDFYNGPYSPRAIQGGKPYPGFQHLAQAIHYYFTAGHLCAGSTLLVLGLLGSLCALKTKTFLPILFFSLTPCFYVMSMYSSGGSPIYVPVLWPFSYYNTRYGIAVVALASFAAGALVMVLPERWRKAAWAVPVLALSPWILQPSMENVVCWKESDVNSKVRRMWTVPAAEYLKAAYKPGQGITARFGDLTGIFCRARIPLRDVLHEGNGPEWLATETRPDLLHPNLWLVSMQNGDRLATSYRPEKRLSMPGNLTIQIYRRAY